MKAQHQAVQTILDEHRTLSAVIDALHHIADDVTRGRLVPDYRLLWSLVYYIDEFPDRLHHPKEDDVLFPRIRARTHDIDATLDDLSRQHHHGVVHLGHLKTLLGRMEAEVPGAAAAFAAKVASYAGFHAAHMQQEETLVLPKAAVVLDEADWSAIADAFAENRDPLHAAALSEDAWFRALYRRIVSMVPEPWGVGARHAPAGGRAG